MVDIRRKSPSFQEPQGSSMSKEHNSDELIVADFEIVHSERQPRSTPGYEQLCINDDYSGIYGDLSEKTTKTRATIKFHKKRSTHLCSCDDKSTVFFIISFVALMIVFFVVSGVTIHFVSKQKSEDSPPIEPQTVDGKDSVSPSVIDESNNTRYLTSTPPVPWADSQCAEMYNNSPCLYTVKYGLHHNCLAGKCMFVHYAFKTVKVHPSIVVSRLFKIKSMKLTSLIEGTPCARNRICRNVVVENRTIYREEERKTMCIRNVDNRTSLIEYPGEWEDNCGRISECMKSTYDNENEQLTFNRFVSAYSEKKCIMENQRNSTLCTGLNPIVPVVQLLHCVKEYGRGRFCRNFPFSVRICKVCKNFLGKSGVEKHKNFFCQAAFKESLKNGSKPTRSDNQSKAYVEVKYTGGCTIFCSLMPQKTLIMPDGSDCMTQDEDRSTVTGVCIMGTCYPKNEDYIPKTTAECEISL